MEITSGYLKPELFWQEIQEIVTLFTRLQIEDLVVFYGFGCDAELELDQLYQDIPIKTRELLAFLSESIAKGYYHLAEDDFFILNRSWGVQFLLGHESDMYLETDNLEIASYMKVRWAAKENPGYERLGGEWMTLQAPQALEAKAEQPAIF